MDGLTNGWITFRSRTYRKMFAN